MIATLQILTTVFIDSFTLFMLPLFRAKLHAIPRFLFRDHLRFKLGIICGRFWGSFAVWGLFAVGDHLRYCTVTR